MTTPTQTQMPSPTIRGWPAPGFADWPKTAIRPERGMTLMAPTGAVWTVLCRESSSVRLRAGRCTAILPLAEVATWRILV